MDQGNLIKRIISRVKNSIVEEIGTQKDIEKEKMKKLKLLFKACALVIYADGQFTVEEFMGLDVIFREMKISDEDRKYFSSCLNKTVSMEEIKKELKEHNYTKEELEEIIDMCVKIAKIDKLHKEEKLVIRKLRNIFGLEG